MGDINHAAQAGSDQTSFVPFLQKPSGDLKTNPDTRENKDLASFIESLASRIKHSDGYYENMKLEKPEPPNWQFAADALMAARIYE